ncbi:MAG: ArsC family transcriptional regulator [Verrucomicrobiales bacterium]|nr:ArsC family transcriptional regulator [Verrucomicrobiales bacterium]
MLKVYEYKGCGTCRKAREWLDARGVNYQKIPIREQPPTKAELQRMLKTCNGNLRKLFNTSGGDYKAMGMKDKLPGMTVADAIDLLATHGNLVKRPFVLKGQDGVVGFNEADWTNLLD